MGRRAPRLLRARRGARAGDGARERLLLDDIYYRALLPREGQAGRGRGRGRDVPAHLLLVVQEEDVGEVRAQDGLGVFGPRRARVRARAREEARRR